MRYQAKLYNLADRVGVEPTRHWLVLTAFKTAATARWLAYPLNGFPATLGGGHVGHSLYITTAFN